VVDVFFGNKKPWWSQIPPLSSFSIIHDWFSSPRLSNFSPYATITSIEEQPTLENRSILNQFNANWFGKKNRDFVVFLKMIDQPGKRLHGQ
jgi:hypothetical protein